MKKVLEKVVRAKKFWLCLFFLGIGAAVGAKGPEPLLNRRGEALAGQLNLNEATAAQLSELPGIGPILAERIIEWRQKKPFKRAEDLLRVKGVGRKRFTKWKPFLRTEGPTDLRWQPKGMPMKESPTPAEPTQEVPVVSP